MAGRAGCGRFTDDFEGCTLGAMTVGAAVLGIVGLLVGSLITRWDPLTLQSSTAP